jgi:hypothetical protein
MVSFLSLFSVYPHLYHISFSPVNGQGRGDLAPSGRLGIIGKEILSTESGLNIHRKYPQRSAPGGGRRPKTAKFFTFSTELSTKPG